MVEMMDKKECGEMTIIEVPEKVAKEIIKEFEKIRERAKGGE